MSGVARVVDTELKSVLIATDFSKASDKPLRHALAIARHYGAKFYLTHVLSSVGYTLAGPQALELASEATAREMQQLEHDLVENGSMAGLDHEFIVRQGHVWEELQAVIAQKQVDLVVVGTHGRRSLGKLLLGSVAEQIFRHANCLVLTVGPGSLLDSPLENTRAFRSFLFATDFGPASVHALPRAISFANHFGVKLVLLHVAPIAPVPEGFHWSSTTGDVRRMRDDARWTALKRLEKLIEENAPLRVQPEFMVKFGMPGKMILQAAQTLGADLVIMGLHRSGHIDTASHLPWDTAYHVVCGATSPVLTVRS